MDEAFLTEEEFAGVDPLNAQFGRVGNRICAGRRWIDIADAASFEVLGRHYAADAHHVYFARGSYWQTIDSRPDRESFEVIADEFARDRSRVFWTCDVLVDVCPETFEPRSKHYATSADEVLYFYAGIHRSVVDDGRYRGIAPIRLGGADASSFEPLAGLYGRDATTLFYHSSVVTRLQVQTTEVLDDDVVKTREEVFFQGIRVEGADPASFVSLGESRFYRDAQHVYVARYGGDDEWLEALEGAGPTSFEVDASGEVAQDASRVYRVVYGEDFCDVE